MRTGIVSEMSRQLAILTVARDALENHCSCCVCRVTVHPLAKAVIDLSAALERLGGICKYCGGRADLPPGHIERCYCLPAIKGHLQHIAELEQQLRAALDGKDLVKT